MSKMICGRCGSVAGTRSVTRGSLLIEIILWLMLIIPGLVYSIWRHTTTHRACRACGATEMVPVSTPAGRALMDRYYPAPPPQAGSLAEELSGK